MSSTVDHDPTPATRAVTVRAVPPRPGMPPQAPTHPPRVRKVHLGRESTTERKAVDDLAEARPVVEQAAPPLPDPTAMCCSVVRAAVEVLRGERSAVQLARWVTPAVLDQLTERARLLREAPAQVPSGRRPAQVRRVRVDRRNETAAEVTVIVEDNGRVRAAAARLEARRGQWRVAVLELG
ncbi:Rv3235 family protein [Xylanimonas allomyrinae]|uniref:Rv3235 family protein n=1 Tax=Xylanimonas allomyrinae TaxID=2509459 RepID=UPI001B87DFB9|nr:Rv3235 family protein [Xylanimonas allomyrinae]